MRRQTSVEIADRLSAECAPRLPSSSTGGVVISCGANDTTLQGAARRVELIDSARALKRPVLAVRGRGWGALVVGPPPIADEAQNQRTVGVHVEFALVCTSLSANCVRTIAALTAESTWMHQVALDDGARPQTEG